MSIEDLILSAMGRATDVNTRGKSDFQPLFLNLWAPLTVDAQRSTLCGITDNCSTSWGGSNALPVDLPHHIVSHTSIKVCAVVVAELIIVDGENNMIWYGQTIVNQVIEFLHEYGGGVCGIPTVVPLGNPRIPQNCHSINPPPLDPIGGPSASYPRAARSST